MGIINKTYGRLGEIVSGRILTPLLEDRVCSWRGVVVEGWRYRDTIVVDVGRLLLAGGLKIERSGFVALISWSRRSRCHENEAAWTVDNA